MGGQDLINTGRRRLTETNKVVGLGRECVSKSMSSVSGRDRKGHLTS
jgi:hypothetical protein